ncbi:phage protein [Enterobacter cloacae]|nr:phage protein [Enterobacter cloacae]
MSTITRELAKLFRKITNSEIDAEGNAHVVLSPADSLLINNARIALASLEAEPVAWLLSGGGAKNHVSFDSSNAYADPLREVTPLYTAPPAPVSVPAAMEMDDDFDSAFEHGKAVGWNAYRAAMLQSFGNSEQLNSPVIQDGWVACVERMPSAGEKVLAYRPDAPESNDPLIKMATYVGGSAHGHGFDCYCKPTHWMPLPAAPQQEVR